VPDGRKVYETDSAISGTAGPLAAVNNYLVPAGCQAHGKLFRERLESAIVCRNTARSKNRNAHWFAIGAML
jgi:hypothetical protein